MTISPPPITSQFQTYDGRVLRVREFAIGGWDMTADLSVLVDISPLTWADVVSVTGMIWSDQDDSFTLIPGYIAYSNEDQHLGIWGINPTFDTLRLELDGLMTGDGWNDDTMDRGKVYVTYYA